MARPRVIRVFELLFLGSLALTLAGAVLVWPAMVEQAATKSGASGLSATALNAIVAAGVAIAALVTLVLWFFIARRGSAVAKWLLVLFTVYNVYATATSMQGGATWGSLSGGLSLAALALQVAAVAMLFTPGAIAWFAGAPEEVA
ncbi:hypothetical protein [uncultured Sphingomonas sp.]|uniref:hypothetical protein n=1 Tax=uncultured Sphingomonas sp. TaxID=158754 RepID=UPI0035CBA3FE